MGNFRDNVGFSEPPPKAVRPGALSRLVEVVDRTGKLGEATEALEDQDELLLLWLADEAERVDDALAAAAAAQNNAADAVRRASAAEAAAQRLERRIEKLEESIKRGLDHLARQQGEQTKTLAQHERRLARLEGGGAGPVKGAP